MAEGFFPTLSWVRAAAFAVALPLSCLGQPPAETPAAAPPKADPAGVSFRAESNLVVIPVSVTDATNRFVLGLRKEDFTLTDDGVEQPVAHFSGEDVPLSIGLAFDVSGSMSDKLETSRQAAATLLKSLNPGDEVCLVEFNDAASVTAGFTGKVDEIQTALDRAQSSGQTALLDAVRTALAEMQKARNARKAIIVVSDGGDNNSKYTAAQIEELVRAADVEIYAMGVFSPLLSLALSPEEISGPRLLSEIATQTGGRAFAASLASDLPSVATRIAIELRNQYVLGYYPKDQARDGKFHTVEVKIAQPRGVPQIKAHWRQGYYAPSAN
ncbi:MAG TPA: VWA domain-containing protein [Bryobacteraceae bacterium]|nr:VWA domain-containing protein [Bryobacteraceae bacterium]